MTRVLFAVEGKMDVPVVEKIIRFFELEPHRAIVANGKSKLDPRLSEIFRSGFHINWLVLRDLDHDAPCAPQLVQRLSRRAELPPRVSLRIPVRAIESWILADKEGLAEGFALSVRGLSDCPDDIGDPARYLSAALGRSGDPAISRIIAGHAKGNRAAILDYATLLGDFIDRTWDPERAATRSPSLRRTLTRLRELATNGAWSDRGVDQASPAGEPSGIELDTARPSGSRVKFGKSASKLSPPCRT